MDSVAICFTIWDPHCMSVVLRLHMLVELERLGTISAVARSLAYSTSAVSQQLTQLERDVGAKLLEPDGRRVRLTAQGEVLVEHARTVVDGWEDARSAVAASLDDVAGTVRLAAFETACLALVPDLVRTLGHEHPAARVSMLQADADDALALVQAREADLAIAESYPGQALRHSNDLVATPLFDDPMLLAVPGDLDREVRGPADAADLDWVVELPGTQAREWAVSVCRRAGFEPRAAYATSDVLVHHHLVRIGLAAAFIPALTPRRLLEGVRLIDLDDVHTRTVFAVSRRSRSGDPLLRTATEILGRRRPSE